MKIQKKNIIGTFGFVVSIISIFIGWIPIFGWIIWLAGLTLSIIGFFQTPKKIAVLGIIISIISICIMPLSFFIAFLISESINQ